VSRKIFISYRRADAADFTVALYQELCDYFGNDSIFKDINAIRPGQSFADVLSEALQESPVVLVVIGPKWISESGERLFNPDDWVRQEIALALEMKRRVVPLLINGAQLPSREQLPEDLHGLLARQAFPIDNLRFESDVERLCKGIEDVIPIRKKSSLATSTLFDNAFKAILLLFMLASLAFLGFAWVISDGEYKEKVFMSILAGAGMVGAVAAFTRQRWIEKRSSQLEQQ
jgi:hypothetical protein